MDMISSRGRGPTSRERDSANGPRWQVAPQALALLLFLTLCFGVAAVGAAFTTRTLDGWYRTLAKPAWNPPDWIFGPVWSVLYLLIAIAGWQFWRNAGVQPVRAAWGFYGSQLLLNVGWSAAFFAWQSLAGAAIEIILLWASIALTIVAFWPRSRMAALLLLPYLGWTTFATVLTFAIWRLNS